MNDANQNNPSAETASPPRDIPILPLYDAVLFPKMVLPLVVTQSESIQLVDEAMSNNRMVGLSVSEKGAPESGPEQEHLSKTGTLALILKLAKTPDNKAQLLVQGLNRLTISKFISKKPYIKANVNYVEEVLPKEGDKEIRAMVANALGLFERIANLSHGLPREVVEMAKTIREPGTLADMTASMLNTELSDKLRVLNEWDIKRRLKEVTRQMVRQLEILELGNKIQTQVKGDMEKSQREYYLRQQLKAIREELGETDDPRVEVEDYREKIKALKLPETAEKEAERELNRLSRMNPASAEYTVASTYLDWITSLPWHTRTTDNPDIKKARAILDKDHYGLEKAKKRIVEYLAVRKLKPDSRGPILCFAGPPGTGKTSLGRSIARALGRNFQRISLGGVRDEAEIRGHRRTYVGALPGRIIQGIRRAGSNNPVFMLDEVDKLGSDFRGDPSSALLEVLDPEQNNTFSDHYLDVPWNLSPVMFITTANILDTIPPALRDRMEVITLHGYTLDEKIKIAKRYLIPRQRKAHGLNTGHIRFTTGAVRHIAGGYTREAGLRNLEREIAAVCRGVASAVAMEDAASVSVTVKRVEAYLGPVRFIEDARSRNLVPGVVMGLAWTQAGGELLFIEATAMKGGKGLTLTGQLGDVMKESATTALSFIRSHAGKLKVSEDFFQKHDIHIHVPAGAIPKDGPSAGVTMLTALASLMTKCPIHRDLAMTGEITLRGQVLPVGGIKEKVLAAHRAGIKTLILPKQNEKDLADIPEKVKREIRFHFVDKMRDVLKLALKRP